MALPDKNYYSLQDISSRWAVPLQDVRYYAEHGLLEIQVWLPDTVVKLYRNKRTEDGDIAPVPVGVSSFKGYAVVEPDEIRKVFRNSPRAVDRFKNPANSDLIKIFDTRTKLMIGVEDLVIFKCERDRFEKECGIEVTDTFRKGKIVLPPPSFPGRPSVMYKIEREFQARIKSDALLPTLAGECRHLHTWARESIKDEQTPSWRAIANALRIKYRHENTVRINTLAKNRTESVV